MTFMQRLLSAEERTVDAPTVIAVWSIAGFFSIAGIIAWRTPEHLSDLAGVGAGAASIIAALGTAGWLSRRGQRGADQQPEPGA